MTQANLEEFRELMEIPIMKSVLKDMEKEWLEKGKAEGEAKGEAKGTEETQQKIAKNLLKAKVDKKLIAEVTGLSLEEINKIKIK